MPDDHAYSPTFSGPVQEYELDQVEERRSRVHSPQNDEGEPEVAAARWKMPKDEPLRADLVGLAFSGGGIRSGTFNLGILQALGRLKLLTRLDFLSTVSGGGYIGGWLAAWIKRAKEDGPAGPGRSRPTAVEAVQGRLDPRTNRQEAGPTRGATEPEPETIHHLREHSRYLAPRFGLFTLDTWSLVAIYARNLLITSLIVAPLLLLLAVLCRGVIAAFAAWPLADPTKQQLEGFQPVLWCLFVGFCVGLVGAEAIVRCLFARVFAEGAAARARPAARASERSAAGQRSFSPGLSVLFAVLLLGMATLGVWLEGPAPWSGEGNGSASRMPQELRVPREPDLRFSRPEVAFGALASAGALACLPDELPAELKPGPGVARVLVRRAGEVLLSVSDKYFGDYIRGMVLFGLLGLLGGAIALVVQLIVRQVFGGRRLHRQFWFLLLTIISGAVFGALFTAIINNLLFFDGRNHPALFATFGPPLVLLALVAANFVETMVAGRLYHELEREWRSRVAALLLISAAGWLLVFGAVVYLPWGLRLLEQALFDSGGQNAVPWGAFVGWLLTTGLGYFAARRTAAGTAGPSLRFIAQVVPVVFLVGLLAIASELSMDIAWLEPSNQQNHFAKLAERDFDHVVRLFVGIAVLTLLSFAGIVFIPATRYSLHTLYMNRLTRAYLGASLRDVNARRGAAGLAGTSREANDFTGFDPHDDLPLAALRVRAGDLPAKWDVPYLGPYPIFNTALNLVAGSELAYQDRKGASFVLTPGYCGSDATGYALLAANDEFGLWNLSLGRAITISGAAIDPNMRNYQSPQLTAFLTILNARLGWWIENPATAEARQLLAELNRATAECQRLEANNSESDGSLASAREAVADLRQALRRVIAATRWTGAPPRRWGQGWPYLRELGGQTDTSWGYVHLSDGGHFENTGAYELIRRRCRHVIVIDAAEDPSDASENLANLIRLVRTDFGIPIDIDTSPVHKDAQGISRWHCAVGAIRYDEVDASGVTGTLIFVRPSLTGDEESDLKNYAATNPPFPHHSTADQFFDEAQFESYRQLGFHVGMEVFGGARQEVGEPPAAKSDDEYRAYTRLLFAALRRAWAPLPDGFTGSYMQSCREYLKTAEDLRDGEPPAGQHRGLRRVSRSLFADARRLPAPVRRAVFSTSQPAGVDTDAYFTDLHEVDYLLQVMELAWLENDLDRFAAHPQNRGWMNVFRRWTASGAFHRFWPVLRGQYSREFVRFCAVALNLAELPVRWCRIPDPNEEPWKGILTDLGVEFCREWAESLRDVDGLKPDRQRTYLSEVANRSRLRSREFLAWVVTTGRGGEESGPITPEEWTRPPDEGGGVRGPEFCPEYRPDHAREQGPQAYLPMGLVAAFESDAAKGPSEWELLVWIRGPYRSLGLGSGCLPWLLDDPRERAIPPYPPFQARKRGILHELPRHVKGLFVRYPQFTGTAGDRLQRTIWTWFFNDNDFVSEYRDPREPEPPAVRLVRKLSGSAAMLTHRRSRGPDAPSPDSRQSAPTDGGRPG